MKAGVVIDAWKLPIFKRHLDKAGFAYTERGAVAPDTLVLQVMCQFASELQPVVEAAVQECDQATKRGTQQ